MTFWLLDMAAPIRTVFEGLAAVSLLSTAMFLILVCPSCGDAVEENEGDGDGGSREADDAEDLELVLLPGKTMHRPASTLWGDMRALGAALRQPSVAALLPALIFIGCENSFWSGAFTDIAGSRFGNKDLALLSGLLAVVDMAASVLAGIALDSKRVHFQAAQIIALCAFVAGSMLVWMVRQGVGSSVLTPFAWATMGSVLMGAGDGIINTAVITRLGSLAEAEQVLSRRTAFQIFQCVNVAMTAITFGVLSAFPADKSFVVWYVLFGSVIVAMGCSLGSYVKRSRTKTPRSESEKV
jgi:hypothetical protein